MKANPLAGEAELVVAGKTHLVKVNMRTVPAMCAAVGADTWPELNQAAMKAANMLPITKALLEANRIEVSEDDVADMDALQWPERILPALLRFDPKAKGEADEAEARPTTARRKT